MSDNNGVRKFSYVDDKEFKKLVKALAKEKGLVFNETRQGKGSHSRVYLGSVFTTVKHGEIGPGLLSAMCQHLNITKKQLGDQ